MSNPYATFGPQRCAKCGKTHYVGECPPPAPPTPMGSITIKRAEPRKLLEVIDTSKGAAMTAADIIRAKLSNFPDHGARDGAAVYKITGAELGTILDELTRDEGRRAVEPILANVSDEDLRALASTHDVGKCRAVLRTVLTSALAAAPSPPVADKPGAEGPVAWRVWSAIADRHFFFLEGSPEADEARSRGYTVEPLYLTPPTGDGKPDREALRVLERIVESGAQLGGHLRAEAVAVLRALPAGGEKSEGEKVSRNTGNHLCGSRDGLTEDATDPLTKRDHCERQGNFCALCGYRACLKATRNSTAASKSATSVEVETGWLIEEFSTRTNQLKARWWDGDAFTADSNAAIRFSRRQDAQKFIDNIGWTEGVPTEHRWG